MNCNLLLNTWIFQVCVEISTLQQTHTQYHCEVFNPKWLLTKFYWTRCFFCQQEKEWLADRSSYLRGWAFMLRSGFQVLTEQVHMFKGRLYWGTCQIKHAMKSTDKLTKDRSKFFFHNVRIIFDSISEEKKKKY